MLKVTSKRRRTRKEVLADKEAEANQEANLQAKLAQIAEAEAKLAHYEEVVQQNAHATMLFQELQADGHVFVDDQGNVRSSKKKPGSEFIDC